MSAAGWFNLGLALMNTGFLYGNLAGGRWFNAAVNVTCIAFAAACVVANLTVAAIRKSK